MTVVVVGVGVNVGVNVVVGDIIGVGVVLNTFMHTKKCVQNNE